MKQKCLKIDLLVQGPVFVEFPIDSLYPYQLVKREIAVSGGPGVCYLISSLFQFWLSLIIAANTIYYMFQLDLSCNELQIGIWITIFVIYLPVHSSLVTCLLCKSTFHVLRQSRYLIM